MVMKKILSAVAALAIFSPGAASAAAILDQQNLISTTPWSDINKGAYTLGQSFTAGLSGTLTRLDLGIYDNLVVDATGASVQYDSDV